MCNLKAINGGISRPGYQSSFLRSLCMESIQFSECLRGIPILCGYNYTKEVTLLHNTTIRIIGLQILISANHYKLTRCMPAGQTDYSTQNISQLIF